MCRTVNGASQLELGSFGPKKLDESDFLVSPSEPEFKKQVRIKYELTLNLIKLKPDIGSILKLAIYIMINIYNDIIYNYISKYIITEY